MSSDSDKSPLVRHDLGDRDVIDERVRLELGRRLPQGDVVHFYSLEGPPPIQFLSAPMNVETALGMIKLREADRQLRRAGHPIEQASSWLRSLEAELYE